MLRALAVALSLFVIPATALAERAEPPAEAAAVVFPLPKDAKAPEMTKGGGGKIATYNVPRGRGGVTTEVRAALKKDAWEIVKDEPSPSGNATRIQAKKAGQLYKVSFTGDDTRTVIILTRP